MTSSSQWRGHVIRWESPWWIYADTGEYVTDRPGRPCGHCGRDRTAEAHDGCLGTLPGVVNACCGHGNAELAYIVYADGTEARGERAVADIRNLTTENNRC